MFNDPVERQALYEPKRLKMLWALINSQRQTPQPNLMQTKRMGQRGNLDALAKGMPNNLPGRPLRQPKIGGTSGNQGISLRNMR